MLRPLPANRTDVRGRSKSKVCRRGNRLWRTITGKQFETRGSRPTERESEDGNSGTGRVCVYRRSHALDIFQEASARGVSVKVVASLCFYIALPHHAARQLQRALTIYYYSFHLRPRTHSHSQMIPFLSCNFFFVCLFSCGHASRLFRGTANDCPPLEKTSPRFYI